MYYLCSINDTVRVPPAQFGKELKKTVLELLQKEYEGVLDEDTGVVVAVTEVEKIGEGKVVPGDGAAYYSVDFKMIVHKPEVGELVEGYVSEITEFGAFLRTGPVEGLIHVSQIMDDYINYDSKLPGFVGKESNRKLVLNDNVMARIVTVSLKGSLQNSKIGLTMRQDGLGKEEWVKAGPIKKAASRKEGGKPSEKGKSEEKKAAEKK